jgi:putative ABC transport system substrate-binding protein
MRRREFITLVGSAAAAWPLVARGQQAGTSRTQQLVMPVVGYLSAGSPEASSPRLRVLREGLSEVGYVEGRNLAIEYRWVGDRHDQLPAMAADLVRQKVAVIVADGSAVAAAKAATTTTPIVFWLAADPVASGLVASLNRPGGNVTGVTNMGAELTPKRLELMHELVPTAVEIALLVNPTNPLIDSQTAEAQAQAAARKLGLQLNILHASTDHDIDAALTTLVGRQPTGIVINPDRFFQSRAGQLAALAIRHSVPAIYHYREFAAAGGLMNYGGSVTSFRTVGNYTGRILKGEKPTDLPVQQATKVELIINLKTAKALGLTVPITLLGRADDVIE